MRNWSVIILFVLLYNTGFAQTYTTTNKKAIEAYEKALSYLNARDNDAAIPLLKKAIKEDKNFVEAYLVLAEVNFDVENFQEAENYYKQAISINSGFYKYVYYYLAETQLSMGKYEEAKATFETFLLNPKIDAKYITESRRKQEICDFALQMMANPVPYNPINLGDSINSKNDEYLPTLTADGQTLIITVRRPRDEFTIHRTGPEEDFYISHRVNGVWRKAEFMEGPINTHGNEGAQSVSPDGKFFVFTACDRPDGLGSCDLYISKKTGNRWSIPLNMGHPVNSAKWESQPSISYDGRTIYFASNREGGKGGSDIWKTVLLPNGKWSAPINIGDTINTEKDEVSPFIHTDDQTLYFASNGHKTLGNKDIFLSRKNTNGRWDIPVNLGYPINTWREESCLIINNAGDTAYFASNQLNNRKDFDLYCFELYKAARPLTMNYLKGTVIDGKTKKKIQAQFELVDLANGITIVDYQSDPYTGEFLVCLPTNSSYALNVSKAGYLFYSENFSINDTLGLYSKDKPYEKNIELKPIVAGEIVILKNIFFDFDKYEIKQESFIELNKLLDLLKKNAKLKIEIRGHTDNFGTDAYNQVLSENRAKAVYEFLTNKGIDATRLSYKGYGESQPVESNATAKGRAINRRIEFKVLEN